MNNHSLRSRFGVWMIVVLAVAGVIVAQRAYAQSATFSVFKHKVNLAALGTPLSSFRFNVITNEPVNCTCTVNGRDATSHGVGHIVLTADPFPTPPGPRLSYVSWSSNGNEHSGSFCPPSAIDTGFLAGTSCVGGLWGQNQSGAPTAGGGAEPTGGNKLVRCSGRSTTQPTVLGPGVFLETASATVPNQLQLHNHLTFTVPARITCDSMDIK